MQPYNFAVYQKTANNMKTILSLSAAILLAGTGFAQRALIDGTPLSVANAATRTVTGTIGHSGNFDGMALNADGSKLLAYNETLRRLYLIDALTNAMIDSVTFTTFMGDFTPGPGNTFYYSDNPTTRIYKVDWTTKARIDSSTAFTSGTANLIPRPGTSDIWATIDNQIHVFNHTSMALTAVPSSVPSSSYIAGRLSFNHTGTKAYYGFRPLGLPGKVYQMDAASKAILDSLVTPDTYGNLKAITPAVNDTTLYIAFWGIWPAEPSKIYLGTAYGMDILDSVNTPHKPLTMTERPGTQELWVVYHYDALVGILNKTAGLAAMDSITVGTNPKYVVFTAGSTGVYTLNGNDNSWSVYPNPCNDILNLASENQQTGTYSITSITGKKITSGEVGVHTTIDMDNLPTGIYILQISTPNATRFLKVTKN